MNTRIKKLRNALKLSQSNFGKPLGVTRTAVCSWENGRREISNYLIISICREYNVNRDWLVDGTGDMFSDFPDTIWNDLSERFDLSDDDIFLISEYCTLPKEHRDSIVHFFHKTRGSE